MKKDIKTSIRPFVIELLAYSVVVLVYFFLVLHFLGGWLAELFRDHRQGYAFIALALIVCQGVVLENVTRFLLRLISPRMEE